AWDAAWDGVRAERKQVGLPNTYETIGFVLRFSSTASSPYSGSAAADYNCLATRHWRLFSCYSPLVTRRRSRKLLCERPIPRGQRAAFRFGVARACTLRQIVKDHPRCSAILILR
ncbi:MAG: hypothetical protein WA746_16720, partial [Isosphaeraceae bacterium]